MKLVVQEVETASMRKFVFGRTVVASEIVSVEVLRAVGRRRNVKGVRELANSTLGTVVLLRLDRPTLRVAGGLQPPQLRALDAIHLAAALGIGDDLDAMVVYDRRLAIAAQEAGIRTVSPGME